MSCNYLVAHNRLFYDYYEKLFEDEPIRNHWNYLCGNVLEIPLKHSTSIEVFFPQKFYTRKKGNNAVNYNFAIVGNSDCWKFYVKSKST